MNQDTVSFAESLFPLCCIENNIEKKGGSQLIKVLKPFMNYRLFSYYTFEKPLSILNYEPDPFRSEGIGTVTLSLHSRILPPAVISVRINRLRFLLFLDNRVTQEEV